MGFWYWSACMAGKTVRSREHFSALNDCRKDASRFVRGRFDNRLTDIGICMIGRVALANLASAPHERASVPRDKAAAIMAFH